jgi:hypothetical protein
MGERVGEAIAHARMADLRLFGKLAFRRDPAPAPVILAEIDFPGIPVAAPA